MKGVFCCRFLLFIICIKHTVNWDNSTKVSAKVPAFSQWGTIYECVHMLNWRKRRLAVIYYMYIWMYEVYLNSNVTYSTCILNDWYLLFSSKTWNLNVVQSMADPVGKRVEIFKFDHLRSKNYQFFLKQFSISKKKV